MAAARISVIMMYAGVGDVKLLNGGLSAWIKAEFPLIPSGTKNQIAQSAIDFGIQLPANPKYFLNTEQVKSKLQKNKNFKLVSIRSWKEYTGETSGYDYIKTKGRIPGDVNGHAGSDKAKLEQYRNLDGTMGSLAKIRRNLLESDIKQENEIAFYCGTGWRASEVFFYIYLMGWENLSLYDGGWLEWTADPYNPIEMGIPTQKSINSIATSNIKGNIDIARQH